MNCCCPFDDIHALIILLFCVCLILPWLCIYLFFRHLSPGCFGLARFLVVVGWLFALCDTAWCYWLAVISPELVMEVEARMNRQYTPPNLHPAGTIPVTVPRSKAYPRPKKPSGLPTVQENNSRGKFGFEFIIYVLWTLHKVLLCVEWFAGDR